MPSVVPPDPVGFYISLAAAAAITPGQDNNGAMATPTPVTIQFPLPSTPGAPPGTTLITITLGGEGGAGGEGPLDPFNAIVTPAPAPPQEDGNNGLQPTTTQTQQKPQIGPLPPLPPRPEPAGGEPPPNPPSVPTPPVPVPVPAPTEPPPAGPTNVFVLPPEGEPNPDNNVVVVTGPPTTITTVVNAPKTTTTTITRHRPATTSQAPAPGTKSPIPPLSTRTKTGIIVGSIFGLLFLIGLLFCCLCLFRRRRKSKIRKSKIRRVKDKNANISPVYPQEAYLYDPPGLMGEPEMRTAPNRPRTTYGREQVIDPGEGPSQPRYPDPARLSHRTPTLPAFAFPAPADSNWEPGEGNTPAASRFPPNPVKPPLYAAPPPRSYSTSSRSESDFESDSDPNMSGAIVRPDGEGVIPGTVPGHNTARPSGESSSSHYPHLPHINTDNPALYQPRSKFSFSPDSPTPHSGIGTGTESGASTSLFPLSLQLPGLGLFRGSKKGPSSDTGDRTNQMLEQTSDTEPKLRPGLSESTTLDRDQMGTLGPSASTSSSGSKAAPASRSTFRNAFSGVAAAALGAFGTAAAGARAKRSMEERNHGGAVDSAVASADLNPPTSHLKSHLEPSSGSARTSAPPAPWLQNKRFPIPRDDNTRSANTSAPTSARPSSQMTRSRGTTSRLDDDDAEYSSLPDIQSGWHTNYSTYSDEEGTEEFQSVQDKSTRDQTRANTRANSPAGDSHYGGGSNTWTETSTPPSSLHPTSAYYHRDPNRGGTPDKQRQGQGRKGYSALPSALSGYNTREEDQSRYRYEPGPQGLEGHSGTGRKQESRPGPTQTGLPQNPRSSSTGPRAYSPFPPSSSGPTRTQPSQPYTPSRFDNLSTPGSVPNQPYSTPPSQSSFKTGVRPAGRATVGFLTPPKSEPSESPVSGNRYGPGSAAGLSTPPRPDAGVKRKGSNLRPRTEIPSANIYPTSSVAERIPNPLRSHPSRSSRYQRRSSLLAGPGLSAGVNTSLRRKPSGLGSRSKRATPWSLSSARAALRSGAESPSSASRASSSRESLGADRWSGYSWEQFRNGSDNVDSSSYRAGPSERESGSIVVGISADSGVDSGILQHNRQRDPSNSRPRDSSNTRQGPGKSDGSFKLSQVTFAPTPSEIEALGGRNSPGTEQARKAYGSGHGRGMNV